MRKNVWNLKKFLLIPLLSIVLFLMLGIFQRANVHANTCTERATRCGYQNDSLTCPAGFSPSGAKGWRDCVDSGGLTVKNGEVYQNCCQGSGGRLNDGSTCVWNEECNSGICRNGQCAVGSGSGGGCTPSCKGTYTTTIEWCAYNGESCAPGSPMTSNTGCVTGGIRCRQNGASQSCSGKGQTDCVNQSGCTWDNCTISTCTATASCNYKDTSSCPAGQERECTAGGTSPNCVWNCASHCAPCHAITPTATPTPQLTLSPTPSASTSCSRCSTNYGCKKASWTNYSTSCEPYNPKTQPTYVADTSCGCAAGGNGVTADNSACPASLNCGSITPPPVSPTVTLPPGQITPSVTLPPGKITPSVTLPPTSCTTKDKGDANCDGKVSGVDYSLWLNSQCKPATGQKCSNLSADFNKDGSVDDADYQIWLSNNGTQGGSTSPAASTEVLPSWIRDFFGKF